MLSICAMITYLCILPASAHSGGTDSQGGHWDRSTGEYHYHHGYGPHDHYDMDGDGEDDCPYQFDSRVIGVTNTSDAYDKGYSAGKKAGIKEGYDSGYKEGEKAANIALEERIQQERKSASASAYTICLVVIFPVVVFFLIGRSSSKEQVLQGEICKLKNELKTLKENSNYHSIASNPPPVTASSSVRPYKAANSRQPFGANTVYISKGGKKYHCKYRCSNATTPVNIEDLPRGYTACRNCVPQNKIR